MQRVSGERLDSLGSASSNTPSSCFHREKTGAAMEKGRRETQRDEGVMKYHYSVVRKRPETCVAPYVCFSWS